MSKLGKLTISLATVFLLLQLARPGIPENLATAEPQFPPDIKRIIQKDCYSCHSDQRRLSWFDQIVPAYWLVRHDILTARQHLNFSTLGVKPAAIQKATLFEAVNMIQLGAMPLPDFVKLHPDAKVTPDELAALKTYLSPWQPLPNSPANAPETAARVPASLTTVSPEFNGLPFDPTFETWKPISTTDRGDNNTFRFILGNDIALHAAQTGNISPWPDGARFAKIAWQQQPGADGLIHPGNFVQVELMVKDAQLYKNTEGWGWGRWRGLDLKPYGNNAKFVTECTTCHLPVRGDDFVYTLPISSARTPGHEVVNNAASLPSHLPYQPLGWSAITMYVDPKSHTMATLYGNDTAAAAAQARRAASAYPPDSVLALVTWVQREDPHWFGGRIPYIPLSVEFVKIAAKTPPEYHRFSGTGLSEDRAATQPATLRSNFIVGLAPATLP